MSLIDDIRAERVKDGTSADPEYVREMEAALLAAEELAKAADDLCERYLEIATGPEDISRSDVDADYVSALRKVAAYRTATGAA